MEVEIRSLDFPGSQDPCTPTKPTTIRRLMVALSIINIMQQDTEDKVSEQH